MPREVTKAPFLPEGALPIGLGCSRLGSINGASGPEAVELIEIALENGIRFFDTSNIYGQGDSERLIGQVLGNRSDCIVCSKAGKYLNWKRRLLLPAKGLIRKLSRKYERTRHEVVSARSKPMPVLWEKQFLQQSIDRSLRRLGREHIEMFMLHGPDAEVLLEGDAMEALEKAKQEGKLGIIGVSPDDVAGAEAALADPRVRCLQLPMHPDMTAFDAVSVRAQSAGLTVIAREIIGGQDAINGALNPAAYARSRIQEVIARPDIDVTLVGTTKARNLVAAIEAVKEVNATV